MDKDLGVRPKLYLKNDKGFCQHLWWNLEADLAKLDPQFDFTLEYEIKFKYSQIY